MDSINNSAASRAPPPFDLKNYISRYETQSETALQRLLFLAHHFHNEEGGDGNNTSTITSNAFEMAVAQMKSTGNYRRYLEEYGAIEASPDNASTTNAADHQSPELTGSPSRSGGGGDHHHPHAKNIIQHYIEYDPNFAPISKIEAQNQLEILEGRLSTAQSHIMKESIRTALLALAEFHKKRGELREALRRVFRSRCDHFVFKCIVIEKIVPFSIELLITHTHVVLPTFSGNTAPTDGNTPKSAYCW